MYVFQLLDPMTCTGTEVVESRESRSMLCVGYERCMYVVMLSCCVSSVGVSVCRSHVCRGIVSVCRGLSLAGFLSVCLSVCLSVEVFVWTERYRWNVCRGVSAMSAGRLYVVSPSIRQAGQQLGCPTKWSRVVLSSLPTLPRFA